MISLGSQQHTSLKLYLKSHYRSYRILVFNGHYTHNPSTSLHHWMYQKNCSMRFSIPIDTELDCPKEASTLRFSGQRIDLMSMTQLSPQYYVERLYHIGILSVGGTQATSNIATITKNVISSLIFKFQITKYNLGNRNYLQKRPIQLI